MSLTENDLKELDIKMGPRKNLMSLIRQHSKGKVEVCPQQNDKDVVDACTGMKWLIFQRFYSIFIFNLIIPLSEASLSKEGKEDSDYAAHEASTSQVVNAFH